MSKFKCKCDYVIDLSISPAEEEGYLVKESLIEKIGLMLDKGKVSADDFFRAIENDSVSTLLCPACHRLWIYSDEDKTYYSYVEERNLEPPND